MACFEPASKMATELLPEALADDFKEILVTDSLHRTEAY